MFMRLMTLTALCVGLTGCGVVNGGLLKSKDKATFDGVQFSGAAKAQDTQARQHFVASVRGASQSMTGAIKAAEHEGIKHCLRYYGTSDITWDVGPDTPPEALNIENDTVTLVGTCVDNG